MGDCDPLNEGNIPLWRTYIQYSAWRSERSPDCGALLLCVFILGMLATDLVIILSKMIIASPSDLERLVQLADLVCRRNK